MTRVELDSIKEAYFFLEDQWCKSIDPSSVEVDLAIGVLIAKLCAIRQGIDTDWRAAREAQAQSPTIVRFPPTLDDLA